MVIWPKPFNIKAQESRSAVEMRPPDASAVGRVQVWASFFGWRAAVQMFWPAANMWGGEEVGGDVFYLEKLFSSLVSSWTLTG